MKTSEIMTMILKAVQGDRAACAKPPVEFKTIVLFWPVLAWLGQTGTFDLKSTGGFVQAALSPCICHIEMVKDVRALVIATKLTP